MERILVAILTGISSITTAHAAIQGDLLPDQYSLSYANDMTFQNPLSDDDTGIYLSDFEGNDVRAEISWQLAQNDWQAGLLLRRTEAGSNQDSPYYPASWDFRQDFNEIGIGFSLRRSHEVSRSVAAEISIQAIIVRREGINLLLGPNRECDVSESVCPHRNYYSESVSLLRLIGEIRFQPFERIDLFLGGGYFVREEYSDLIHHYGARVHMTKNVSVELRGFDYFFVKGQGLGIRFAF